MPVILLLIAQQTNEVWDKEVISDGCQNAKFDCSFPLHDISKVRQLVSGRAKIQNSGSLFQSLCS